MTRGVRRRRESVPDELRRCRSIGSYALQAAAGATGTKIGDRLERRRHRQHADDRAQPRARGHRLLRIRHDRRHASRSVSTSSQNGVTTSNASTRMANKVLTIVRWGEVRRRRSGSRRRGTTRTFTLNWTTNDANAVRHPLHRHRRLRHLRPASSTGRCGTTTGNADGRRASGSSPTSCSTRTAATRSRRPLPANHGRRRLRPRRHGLRRR